MTAGPVLPHEPNSAEDTLPPCCLVAWGFLQQLWCARDGATDQDVVEAANMREPTGTKGGTWIVLDDPDLTKRCPDYPNRRHVLVNC